MLGVVLGAGTAGFLLSAGLLSLGVGSMALRYTLAACAGYLAFLLGIKIWLTRRLGQAQRERSRWLDHIDPSGLAPDSAPAEPSFTFGGGGEFSGSGAGSSINAPSPVSPMEPADSDSIDLIDVVDLDESLAVIVVPIVLLGFVFAGLFGSFAIVLGAPSLLAEVLLDGIIAAWAYRHLRQLSPQHWLAGVVRRSWKPFAAILVSLAIGGYALQALVPGVRSIGDLWR